MVPDKRLLTFTAIIVLILGVFWVRTFPEQVCFRKINIPTQSVLSPDIRLNDPDLEKCFISALEKFPGYGGQDFSLTDIFGPGRISRIFDVATGNGAWMREVSKQRWVAADASIIGFDLEEPVFYQGVMHSMVFKERDWKDQRVIHKKDDPNFPKPGSLDLLHEAFMDASSFKSQEPRLEMYDSLVKEGGWFLFAHVSHKSYIQPTEFTDWLEKKNYAYQVINTASDPVPPDYPQSFWWKYFDQEFVLGRSSHPNYMIVAQKTARIKKIQAIDYSGLWEESI